MTQMHPIFGLLVGGSLALVKLDRLRAADRNQAGSARCAHILAARCKPIYSGDHSEQRA